MESWIVVWILGGSFKLIDLVGVDLYLGFACAKDLIVSLCGFSFVLFSCVLL